MSASVVGGARQEHTSLLITANAAGISAMMVATFMLEFGLVLEVVFMYAEALGDVQNAMAYAAGFHCVR
jgi:hypothetical protein